MVRRIHEGILGLDIKGHNCIRENKFLKAYISHGVYPWGILSLPGDGKIDSHWFLEYLGIVLWLLNPLLLNVYYVPRTELGTGNIMKRTCG